jgi:hypothetical protein
MSQNRDRDTVSGVIWSQLEASQRGKVTSWTVYDRPRDHSVGFIARRFEIGSGVTTPTEDVLSGELEHLREVFERAGLVKIMRSEGDEPQIVESWF